LLFKTGYPVH